MSALDDYLRGLPCPVCGEPVLFHCDPVVHPGLFPSGCALDVVGAAAAAQQRRDQPPVGWHRSPTVGRTGNVIPPLTVMRRPVELDERESFTVELKLPPILCATCEEPLEGHGNFFVFLDGRSSLIYCDSCMVAEKVRRGL